MLLNSALCIKHQTTDGLNLSNWLITSIPADIVVSMDTYAASTAILSMDTAMNLVGTA